ncbi:MAG: hypothetical protein Q8Q59_06305 [Luteolibacter sp.]|nr:hypothetical protein [Luteolibacter sp.]
MADKEIIIGLKTVGDTSGAEAVEKSLMQVEDAAKQAERELDVIEAKRRKAERETGASGKPGGNLGTDVSSIVQGAGQQMAESIGLGRQFQAVASVVSADAVAVGASLALTGKAAVEAYNIVTKTVDGYKKLMADAAAAGQDLGPELEEEIRHLEMVMSPLRSTIESIGGAWDWTIARIKDPVGEFSGLNDLKASLAQTAGIMKLVNEARLKIANESQSGLTTTYNNELAALKEQEATIKRIAALRNELAGLEVQGARQEVEAARLRGGDVELAEANALAAELRASLAKLGDDLTASKNGAEQARTELDSAMVKYQDAIRTNMDKLDPEQFAKLSAAVDTAQKRYDDATQAITDQQQIFEAAKTNLLRGAENELAKLDTESKGAINSAADKARTSIYETIKTEFDSIGSATGAVKTAVNAAGEQTKQSIEAQGTATVSMLAQIMAGNEAVVAKINSHEARINQIFARLR